MKGRNLSQGIQITMCRWPRLQTQSRWLHKLIFGFSVWPHPLIPLLPFLMVHIQNIVFSILALKKKKASNKSMVPFINKSNLKHQNVSQIIVCSIYPFPRALNRKGSLNYKHPRPHLLWIMFSIRLCHQWGSLNSIY